MFGNQKPPSASLLFRKPTILRMVCCWFFIGCAQTRYHESRLSWFLWLLSVCSGSHQVLTQVHSLGALQWKAYQVSFYEISDSPSMLARRRRGDGIAHVR
jgi:hypothetical protein